MLNIVLQYSRLLYIHQLIILSNTFVRNGKKMKKIPGSAKLYISMTILTY